MAKVVWEDREGLGKIKADSQYYATQIRAKEKAIQSAERSRGMTTDEIKESLAKSESAYQRARNDIQDLSTLHRVRHSLRSIFPSKLLR